MLVFAGFSNAQIATGGDFRLEQKVIAGGGGESNDSTALIFNLKGTLGQKAAGTTMAGGDFTQVGGFWNPIFAPTAAGVEISGRAIFGKDAENEKVGIKNAIVTLTGGMLTAPRTTRTDAFGNFKFEDVEVGHFYVLQIRHKQFDFINDTQTFTLTDNMNNLVFQANKQFGVQN